MGRSEICYNGHHSECPGGSGSGIYWGKCECDCHGIDRMLKQDPDDTLAGAWFYVWHDAYDNLFTTARMDALDLIASLMNDPWIRDGERPEVM